MICLPFPSWRSLATGASCKGRKGGSLPFPSCHGVRWQRPAVASGAAVAGWQDDLLAFSLQGEV